RQRTQGALTMPTLPSKRAPFRALCYRIAAIWLSEGRVHDLGGPVVAAVDQMPIDIERDHGISVTKAAADGQDVHAARDQHGRVGVAQRVYRNLGPADGVHGPFPCFTNRVGGLRRAVSVRRSTHAEHHALLLLGAPVVAEFNYDMCRQGNRPAPVL